MPAYHLGQSRIFHILGAVDTPDGCDNVRVHLSERRNHAADQLRFNQGLIGLHINDRITLKLVDDRGYPSSARGASSGCGDPALSGVLWGGD